MDSPRDAKRPEAGAAVSSRRTGALVLLAAAVAASFVGFMLVATEAHFVPQVVDLYLVCQYARAMAEGHPFQYNPGEAPSTGSTSLLYTAVLAAAHAVGIRGEGLIAFAIFAGAGLLVAASLLARRVATRLGEEREGWLAGALVALGGPVVWGFLYGSDIGLFMALSLWLLDGLIDGWRTGRLRSVLAAGVLLGLARPEGLPLGLMLGAALSLGPARAWRGWKRLLPWLPAAAGLSVLALYRVLTGYWTGTSVADKSLLDNYGFADSLALAVEYGIDVIRGLLLGFYPSQTPLGFARGWAPYTLPPLALVPILVAVARPAAGDAAPVRVWAGMVAVVWVLAAPNVFMGVHFNRYLMWAFPGLLVLVAVGLGRLTRLLARDAATERGLFRAAAGLVLVTGLLATLRFAVLYGDMAGEIYRRDVAAARWIQRQLPAGVAIANLATSVEYLTGHRSLNLHGVTTPAFFGNRKAEREAGVFEALGRLPEHGRPPYLITSVSAQQAYPTMRELVDGPPIYHGSSLGDELLVFRMRYDLVDQNRRPYLPATWKAVAGLREVDRLNVCDTRDERDHDYVFTSRLGNLRLHGTARIADYAWPGGAARVIDGGRPIFGSESFRVRTQPGKDLVIVLRTAGAMQANLLRASGSGQFGVEFPEATVVVRIDDQAAARLTFRPAPGFDEQVLRLPGSFLSEERTRLTFWGRYASFHYWFFQP